MSDWYGTSRAFARALSSSNIPIGSRIEMLAVEGLRLGKLG